MHRGQPDQIPPTHSQKLQLVQARWGRRAKKTKHTGPAGRTGNLAKESGNNKEFEWFRKAYENANLQDSH